MWGRYTKCHSPSHPSRSRGIHQFQADSCVSARSSELPPSLKLLMSHLGRRHLRHLISHLPVGVPLPAPPCLPSLPSSSPHSLAFAPGRAQSHLGLCNVHPYLLTSAVTSVPGNLSRTCPNRLHHTHAHGSPGHQGGLMSELCRSAEGRAQRGAQLCSPTLQALLSSRTRTRECFRSSPCLSLFTKGKFPNGPFTAGAHGQSAVPVMGGAGGHDRWPTLSRSLHAMAPHSPG